MFFLSIQSAYAYELSVRKIIGLIQSVDSTMLDEEKIQNFKNKDTIDVDHFVTFLHKKLSDEDYTRLMRNTNDIAFAYFYLERYNLALDYYHLAVLFANQNQDARHYADLLCATAQTHARLNSFIEAVDLYKQAYIIYKDYNETNRILSTSNMLGGIYNKLGLYDKSLQYQLEALDIVGKSDFSKISALTYANIGNTYAATGNLVKALTFHQRALEIRKMLKDDFGIAQSLDEMGSVYEKLNDLDKALLFYAESIELKQNIGLRNDIPITQYNIGKIYERKNDSFLAEKFYSAALKLSDETNNKILKSKILIDLSSILFGQGRNAPALKMLDEGLEIALKIDVKENIKNAYQNLAAYYEQIGDMKQALFYFKKYSETKDLILNSEKNRQIVELETKYETNEIEQQNQLLRKEQQLHRNELEINKRLNYILLGFGLFLLLFAVYFYYSNRLKQKINTKLNYQNAEIEVSRRKLEDSYQTLQKLSNLGKDITTKLNEDEIKSTVFKGLRPLIDSDDFGIGIVNTETNSIDFYFITGEKERVPKIEISLNEDSALAVRCFKKQEHIFVGEYSKEYAIYGHTEPQSIFGRITESIIFQPLTINNKPKGVVAIQSSKKNAFDNYHIYTLNNLANYIAIALDNSDTYSDIERQKTELHKLNKTKDKMFSIIAHDLRNPISTFIYMLEMLASPHHDWKSTDINSIINDLTESAVGSLNLLDNLLVWARSQRGELIYIPENVFIEQLITENIDLIKTSSTKKDITINSRIEKDLFVFADKNMLNTIIRNLIANALKFTPRHGTITIEAYKFINNLVEIVVTDTGVGISKENVSRFFDKDFQLSTKGTENEKGSGLGLALCFEFVETNKGSMLIESQEGKGSKFKVRLPQA